MVLSMVKVLLVAVALTLPQQSLASVMTTVAFPSFAEGTVKLNIHMFPLSTVVISVDARIVVPSESTMEISGVVVVICVTNVAVISSVSALLTFRSGFVG